jgi:hypothetical protein
MIPNVKYGSLSRPGDLRMTKWLAGGVLFGLAVVTAGCLPRGETGRDATRDGSGACETCHPEQVLFWRHGGHRRLGCDVCHGAPGEHLRVTIVPRPRLETKGPGHCLECHLRRPGQTADPPRIDGLAEHLAAIEKKHVMKVDRVRSGDDCAFCHEPHLLE